MKNGEINEMKMWGNDTAVVKVMKMMRNAHTHATPLSTTAAHTPRMLQTGMHCTRVNAFTVYPEMAVSSSRRPRNASRSGAALPGGSDTSSHTAP